ncbi:MAG: S8 family serine peptidase, partial [Acidothermaceae bacterium]
GGDNGNGNGQPGQGDATDPTCTPDVGVVAPTTIGGVAGQDGSGSGVTVALIDTGVSDTDALNRASGRLVDAVDTSGLNSEHGGVIDHGTFSDGYGHGTFMASLIAGGKVAGSGDTALGVAPGATVDILKVADSQGNTSLAAVLAGLNWVATHASRVDVANLSLSVDRPSNSYGIDPLNFAVSLTRDTGVTVVVAAGNTPGVVGDPGFAPDSLTVGAADTTGTTPSVASFSGYDNVDGVTKPDVVAAGVNILGEMPQGSVISQQFPGARQPSGLFRGSGTSQSTAVVSGLAALYIQSHHDASPLLVKSAIRNAATSIGSGKADGQGLVAIPSTGNQRFNTGENDLNVGQWFAGAASWGGDTFNVRLLMADWLSRSWMSRSWMSRSWMDGTWDSRSWLSRTWLSRSWLSRSWLSRSWVDGAWDSRSWLSRSWMSRSWMSRSWVSRSWVSDVWAARSWMAAAWGDGS